MSKKKLKLKKDLDGTYGWNVSNFIESNDLHDLAREIYGLFDGDTNDEMIQKIYEWDTESGWEILCGQYIHVFPSEIDGDDYCDIIKIEDAEAEALHNAKYTFEVRDDQQILLVPKVKREKVQNYVNTVQIGFDIAIPEGMDSIDVEKFMENEVATFIEKTSRLAVLNGIYCAEDMNHAYEIEEVNKMANPKTK